RQRGRIRVAQFIGEDLDRPAATQVERSAPLSPTPLPRGERGSDPGGLKPCRRLQLYSPSPLAGEGLGRGEGLNFSTAASAKKATQWVAFSMHADGAAISSKRSAQPRAAVRS